MKKLYLSSYRIPNPDNFLGLFNGEPGELKGGVIINAKDKKPSAEREQKVHDFVNYLGGLGLRNVQLVDLRKGTNGLGSLDYLWGLGGNTFDLRRAMIDSNFDEFINEYLEKGGVYGGDSAGAIVAGPSLRGFELMDDLPEDPVWHGMGLTDIIIVPHHDSPDPRYRGKHPEISRANPGRRVISINDNQDFVINE